MTNVLKVNFFKRQRPSSLLGLALDGTRLSGVVVRRTNGSLKVEQSFQVSLSLDPLANDAELVGREIRNHLEAAGIRERRCAVCVPLSWAMTLHTKIPEVPEEDVASFLQIEAERGFSSDADTLIIERSRYRAPGGEEHATLVGINRSHLARLEAGLRAAQLKPYSFSLGITALQQPDADPARGALALAIGELGVGLLITLGGGVAVLRALEGALSTEGGHRELQTDHIAREIRITLGQLPADARAAVKRVRIFGSHDLARNLASDLRERLTPTGVTVEAVTSYAPDEFGVQLPSGLDPSPAVSLAARLLAGRGTGFEFLPPRVTAWQQFSTRYASKKLGLAGLIGGAAALLIGGLFGYQSWQLSRWGTQWAQIQPRVREVQDMQQQIRKYRPWFDESLYCLSILRGVTEAFPEDGVVTAKTIEIREQGMVTCTGSARENASLQAMERRLCAVPGVSQVHTDQTRGKSPLQFTFEFHWGEQRKNEN